MPNLRWVRRQLPAMTAARLSKRCLCLHSANRSWKRCWRNLPASKCSCRPMYSAIKINGKKLYQLARQGVEVERTARPIEVYKLELLHYTETSFTVRVACSKGTYIRVLGEDLATALGTCGTMSFLLRTQVGAYTIDKACTLQEIAENPEACAAEPLTAVAELPKLKVNARQAARITNGVRTTVAQTADGRYVLLGPGDEFLGIVRCEQERLQAEKILEHYPMPEE